MARHSFARILAVCLAMSAASPAAQPSRLMPSAFRRPSTVIVAPDTIFRMLKLPQREPRELGLETKWRGGAEVFQAVAPSVVVVRTELGHGSGFIMSADGLVVTNHHVIASGLIHDPAKNGSYATVHLGRLGPDGTMALLPDGVRAYLVKTDPTRDLALLRIAGPVSALPSLPHLVVSDVAPRPGQDCAIVGHPSSGMLWTMRPGQVAAVGQMPTDLVNVIMLKLASPTAQREELVNQFRQLPSRRIIITSAGANPGDSGGPVVDERGRVIAVTFGGPGKAEESKFTYHVHLDELKAVLADVPKEPMFLRPDPWALGPRVEVRDIDGDDTPDLLLSGSNEPETMLFDVDNDTPPALARDTTQLVAGKKWDFEVGLSLGEGSPAAFYDTDNDGVIDLILTGRFQDGFVDGRFVRVGPDQWTYESGLKLALLSGQYLKAPKLAMRADQLIKTVLERR
jgi:S1-C subfamily serine protease